VAFEDMRALAAKVVAVARPALPARRAHTLDTLVADGEPGLAIKFALDWSIEGEWDMPVALAHEIKDSGWGHGPAPKHYLTSLDLVLARAERRELTPA